mgnify:CR=1 FL=1
MTYGKFIKLPHCQYSVYSADAAIDGYEADCGLPASYRIEWGEKQKLYICEDHAAEIETSEEEDCAQNG